MDGEKPSDLASDLSPEAEAIDRRARDIISDLTEADVRRPPATEAPAGEIRVERTVGDPTERHLQRITGRIRTLAQLLFGEHPLRAFGAMLTMVILVILAVSFVFGPGDGGSQSAAAPDTTQAVVTTVVEAAGTPVTQGAGASESPAGGADAAPVPATGECLLSGVLEVSSVMTEQYAGQLEPPVGTMSYTAYRGQSIVTNTSDQAVRVRSLHMFYSNEATNGPWSGGYLIEPGASVEDSATATAYEDGSFTYDVLTSVAAYVDSPDCARLYGSVDFAELEPVAVAVPNPLPIGP